jgi:hypothetical protein
MDNLQTTVTYQNLHFSCQSNKHVCRLVPCNAVEAAVSEQMFRDVMPPLDHVLLQSSRVSNRLIIYFNCEKNEEIKN